MKILYAASEAVPFCKTGGLADVAGSLPAALAAQGADVAVVLPLYQKVKEKFSDQLHFECYDYVDLAWRHSYCGLFSMERDGVTWYFLDNEQYFRRPELYGYMDDGERFGFFSRAVVRMLPHLRFWPEVIHCNDWQTALVPIYLKDDSVREERFRSIRTVLSIHNIEYQGRYGRQTLGDLFGLDHGWADDGTILMDGDVNLLKGAILCADAVNAVSPTYANELKMPFYGEGMDGIFRRRSNVLSGILNGIDQTIWNPASDPMIPANYSIHDMDQKADCKRALQEELGLDQDPTRPLVVSIGRLTDQKGLGLVRYSMDHLMQRGVQVAILGTGDHDHEEAFKFFQSKYPGKMCARIAFDNALSHRMYAGGDILLMPSEFEPCGLSQMIAMRYGTLPVVRETGGLRDSVAAYNKFTGEGTGFSFANMNADEMADTLLGACEIFWTDKSAWDKLVNNAMSTDFSWRRAANDYMDIYHWLHPEIIRYNKRRDR